VGTIPQDVFMAKDLDMPDFEDSVISAIASRNEADYIVTRNIEDFENSPIVAITPSDFIRLC